MKGHTDPYRAAMELTTSRRSAVVALLFGAMAVSALAMSALGVVASFIIDDLSISRATMGWIVATNVVLAALLSPFIGRLADRIGGRLSLIAVFCWSAVTFALFGLAPTVLTMFVAAAVSAASQASGNPATNLIIEEQIRPGRRGVVTGIKQSGVQAGITVAGLSLPAIALRFGWRASLIVVAVVALIGGVVAYVMVPAGKAAPRSTEVQRRLPASTWWLTGYSATFGFAGAVSFFVPLFSEEQLGLDPRVAGAVVAVSGLVAMGARIGWARYAERSNRYRSLLASLTFVGAAAGLVSLGSMAFLPLIWVGAVLIGVSLSAWNSVGMLAVINDDTTATGSASGIVLFGFLTGLGLGPPAYGVVVDASGSYVPMWGLSILACAVSYGVTVAWKRRTAPPLRI